MDSSTASAFYNALTDILWNFGQVIYSMIEILSMLISLLPLIYVGKY